MTNLLEGLPWWGACTLIVGVASLTGFVCCLTWETFGRLEKVILWKAKLLFRPRQTTKS